MLIYYETCFIFTMVLTGLLSNSILSGQLKTGGAYAYQISRTATFTEPWYFLRQNQNIFLENNKKTKVSVILGEVLRDITKI